MMEDHRGKFFVGKVSDFTQKKGWFFGHFMEEELLRSSLIEVAWQDISGKKPASTDKHYHKNSVEINIVISGGVKFTINGQQQKVTKGGFWVVYPYTVIENFEAGENTEQIVIRAPSMPGDKFKLKIES